MDRRIGMILPLLTLLAPLAARAGGEICGVVETTRGEVLRGTIRWDQDENFWEDRLDAVKGWTIETETQDEPRFRFSLFGLKIGGDEHGSGRSLSVPFGRLRKIEPIDARSATIELKSGERLRLRSSSSDLGGAMRDLVIEDPDKGRVELPWHRIARVEFAGDGKADRDRERLYGTARTTAGEFTGFLVWDRDESLTGDLLDGEADGEDHEIPFGEIAAIEPRDSSSARIVLRSGKERVLSGTNDVNADMRDLLVEIEGLGRVEIGWKELRIVEFREPPASRRYDTFHGGRRLSGTVLTRSGESLRGRISWDLDEQYSWERLEGRSDGVDYSVSLSEVRSILPRDRHSSELRLRGDRTLVLSGTNDVDADNRGILITAADGSERVVAYVDVVRVDLD